MHALRRSRLLRVMALVFALALVAAACDSDDDDEDETPTTESTAAPADDGDDGDDGSDGAGGATSGTIEASDQESDGTTVAVASATLEGGAGFIVVHADSDGAPGEVVGHAAIPEGASADVVVTLDRTVESGTYWPMLHTDEGVAGEYEFPGPDGPVTVDGAIVMVPIEVTVT